MYNNKNKSKSPIINQNTNTDTDIDISLLNIEIKKIINILNVCKQKLEIALIFYQLLKSEEGKKYLIETYVDSMEKDFINFINEKKYDTSDKFIKNVEILIKKNIHTKIISNYSQQLTTNMKQFLQSFTYLINYTQKHMKLSINNNNQIKQIDHPEHINNEIEIQKIRTKIQTIQEKYKTEENHKRDLINEYKEMIITIQQQKKQELMNIAQKADKEMILEWQTIEYELNNLQREEKTINEKYEYLCRENLNNEKYLREKKYQKEEILEEFINVYDVDMGKKHTEHENIKIQMTIEKDKLENLTKLFEEQKSIYEFMIEEKTIWKEKELAKKLLKLRTMLAKNTISKFIENYIKTLRENNIPIVITKKSKGKKKK